MRNILYNEKRRELLMIKIKIKILSFSTFFSFLTDEILTYFKNWKYNEYINTKIIFYLLKKMN